MSSTDASQGKICAVCGKDCSTSPRTKDSRGRYYHRTCHEGRKKERAAVASGAPAPDAAPVAAVSSRKPAPPPPLSTEPPDDDMGFGLLDDMSAAEAQADAIEQEQKTCPSCKNPMAAGAVICMRCGYNEARGARMV